MLLLIEANNHQFAIVGGFPGNHGGRHGGAAGLRPRERPRLRRDRCPKSAVGSRAAGVFQVGEATHDSNEKPVGGEGVERPVERQVISWKFTLTGNFDVLSITEEFAKL